MSFYLCTFCQNTRMRLPIAKQPKVSPRNHGGDIAAINPVTPQTTPKNIAARPVNGTNAGYFVGFRAKIIKYTPTGTYIADPTRIAYSTNGETGRLNDSTPENLTIDSHAEAGRNIPNPLNRHEIPAIHRQIFNARIYIPFRLFMFLMLIHPAVCSKNPMDRRHFGSLEQADFYLF